MLNLLNVKRYTVYITAAVAWLGMWPTNTVKKSRCRLASCNLCSSVQVMSSSNIYVM